LLEDDTDGVEEMRRSLKDKVNILAAVLELVSNEVYFVYCYQRVSDNTSLKSLGIWMLTIGTDLRGDLADRKTLLSSVSP